MSIMTSELRLILNSYTGINQLRPYYWGVPRTNDEISHGVNESVRRRGIVVLLLFCVLRYYVAPLPSLII